MESFSFIDKLLINRLLKKDVSHEKEKRFLNFYQIKSVLLIYDNRLNDIESDFIDKSIRLLQNENKKVDKILIVKSKKELDAEFQYITYQKNYLLFKKLEFKGLEEVLSKQFDLLILFTRNVDYPILDLITRISATLRVFPKTNYNDFADIVIISKSETYFAFLEQTIKYLKNIKTENNGNK